MKRSARSFVCVLLLGQIPSLLLDMTLRDCSESRAHAGFGVHLGQILGCFSAVCCIRPHDQGCENGAVCGTVCALFFVFVLWFSRVGDGGRRLPSGGLSSVGKSDQFFPKKKSFWVFHASWRPSLGSPLRAYRACLVIFELGDRASYHDRCQFAVAEFVRLVCVVLA